MTEETKSYRVTDAAGAWVAGRRVPTVSKTRTVKDADGKPVEETVLVPDPKFRFQLTDRQAQYELLNGTIEPDAPKDAEAERKPASSGGSRAASDPAAGAA